MSDELEVASTRSDVDVPIATNEPSADLEPNPTLNGNVSPGHVCAALLGSGPFQAGIRII